MSVHVPKHIVAASALIRNRKGEIALVKTERRGWELPGGQIELGETLTEGLRREIYEECGLEVELGRLAHVRSNLSSCIVIFCFHATYVRGELRPSEETPQTRWAAEQRALELITHPRIAHEPAQPVGGGRQDAVPSLSDEAIPAGGRARHLKNGLALGRAGLTRITLRRRLHLVKNDEIARVIEPGQP